MTQNFAQFLRKYIVRSGESVYYFQQQSDVPSGQIYRYINDMSLPSLIMYARIMKQIIKQEKNKRDQSTILIEAHESILQSMQERNK